MEKINRKEIIMENIKAISEITGLPLYMCNSGFGYFLYVIDSIGRYQYTPFGLRTSFDEKGYTLKELYEITRVIRWTLVDIRNGKDS